MAPSKTLKSATSVMATAQFFTIACRFARNVILARLLLPADFGVGATFAITLSFWEMISELGPRKLLVQAPEGGSKAWQENAQLLFVVRGVVQAVLLFLLAPTVASYFDLPGAVLSFQLLAIVPLLRGFVHCDMFRFQRDLKLGRLAIYESIPIILGVLAAPIFALSLGNYRAFLGVILTESLLATLLSHLLAERTYRWSYEKSIVQRFVGFGWPLIGNGLLLFTVMHGDRFLVASYFTLEQLGPFSVVFTLAMVPTQAFAKIHGAIALPLFSRTRGDTTQLQAYCWQSAQLSCLLSGLLATTFVTAGPWLVQTIYGKDYLLASEAIPWIGLMCAVRHARTTVSMAILSHGLTKIPLLSNLARAASFLVAWGLASNGFELAMIPICGVFGETVALFVSVFLFCRKSDLSMGIFNGPFFTVSSFVVCVWLMTRFEFTIPGLAPPMIALLWFVALLAYCALLWPTLRGLAFGLLRPRSSTAT